MSIVNVTIVSFIFYLPPYNLQPFFLTCCHLEAHYSTAWYCGDRSCPSYRQKRKRMAKHAGVISSLWDLHYTEPLSISPTSLGSQKRVLHCWFLVLMVRNKLDEMSPYCSGRSIMSILNGSSGSHSLAVPSQTFPSNCRLLGALHFFMRYCGGRVISFINENKR